MESTVDCLTALVCSAITGEKAGPIENFDSRFDEIMRLARSHEIAHLVAAGIINSGIIKDEEHLKVAEKCMFDAVYRDMKNEYTYKFAAELLIDAEIPFVPLKGIIIKKVYPESWMRTSCDTDLLVKKKDFDRAVVLLENNGFAVDGDINYHDVSLLYDDTNLELHFSICENMKNIDSVLKNVWENVNRVSDFKYLENHDFFVFHHIAHMSYHFLAGGCGIRPFLDLWLLRKNNFYDRERVSEFCRAAKIYDFYKATESMASVWFEGADHNDITKKVEKYVLTGGAYGYFPNNAAAYTVRQGGKVRYLLSMAFPRYTNMKVMYPVLNKAPYLLPLCYVHRLFEKTVGKSSRGAKQKYKTVRKQDAEFIKEVSSLLKALKLDK